MIEKIPRSKKDEISEEKNSPEKPDKRKEVAECLEDAKEQLKYRLDIDNLSNIELVHLRRIVEECLRDVKKIEDSGSLEGFGVHGEAAFRWLYELYGINLADIPADYYLWKGTMGQNNVKGGKEKFKTKSERDQRARELDVAGVKSLPYSETTADFKEYLKILREKAHKP